MSGCTCIFLPIRAVKKTAGHEGSLRTIMKWGQHLKMKSNCFSAPDKSVSHNCVPSVTHPASVLCPLESRGMNMSQLSHNNSTSPPCFIKRNLMSLTCPQLLKHPPKSLLTSELYFYKLLHICNYMLLAKLPLKCRSSMSSRQSFKTHQAYNNYNISN